MLAIREIQAKSILNKSKIYDYCVNPYTGCQVNCGYCYARLFMRRYSGHAEPWGEFVDVKINAPEILEKQLARAKRGTVWVSSVCDCYQPVERTYALTRSCLEVLAGARFPVNIQTKSVLVLRDLDVLGRFEEIEVGMTITTADEKLAAAFEPGASKVGQRIEALRTVRAHGIPTFAFIGPLLPGGGEELVAALSGAVDRLLVDRMNYLETIIGFYRKLGLAEAATDGFFREQASAVARAAARIGLPCEIVF